MLARFMNAVSVECAALLRLRVRLSLDSAAAEATELSFVQSAKRASPANARASCVFDHATQTLFRVKIRYRPNCFSHARCYQRCVGCLWRLPAAGPRFPAAVATTG